MNEHQKPDGGLAHTPLPWQADPSKQFDEASIVAGGQEIGLLYCGNGLDESTPFPGRANAAFVVRAVNHHAALVEIAQESLAYAEQAGDKRRADYIRAVLASAQPTEGTKQ